MLIQYPIDIENYMLSLHRVAAEVAAVQLVKWIIARLAAEVEVEAHPYGTQVDYLVITLMYMVILK